MLNSQKYKTAEERAAAFYKFCHDRVCEKCELYDMTRLSRTCCLFWLDLDPEAEAEKPLPCPCCRKEVRETYNFDYTLKKLMCDCGYQSPWVEKDRDHISHNRIARAVMEADEEVAE